MVNYALLYGKTAFTLATDIGVSRKEAQTFIDAYFARYPAVRRFIDETIAKARETGTVRTLLGRLRRLPDLRSKNVPIRMEAERQAMNTPVQGSAADLIKKAMIDLHRELRERGMKSRLILQIHDELLLETPEAEAERALRARQGDDGRGLDPRRSPRGRRARGPQLGRGPLTTKREPLTAADVGGNIHLRGHSRCPFTSTNARRAAASR